MASQMVDALYDRTVIDIDSKGISDTLYGFKISGSVPKFDGFRVLYTEGRDDPADDDEEVRGLPVLTVGDSLKCEGIKSDQNFTEPLPRYTEATLIRNLEAQGIGRPSTYASIIGTIQDRDYVRRDRGRFTPTKLGIVVTEFLLNILKT